MKKISNNPNQRARSIYSCIDFHAAFTPEELERIIAECAKHGVERGTISESVFNDEIRKSNIKFHNRNEENSWIFERLNWVIETVNEDFFNFDLNGYDSFQYAEYDSAEQGKYDFHMDMWLGDDIPPNSVGTRKLSLTFLLSEPDVDFEGGDFQILVDGNPPQTIEMKKGQIAAFPSFIIHRVTPVTKGERKSIVVWVEGPKFR
jgi:PKHD-type hydroxylase